MSDSQLIIDYRIRVIHTGLIVSWFGLIMFALWAFSTGARENYATTTILIAIAAGLVLITVAPWRSMLTSSIGDWVILIWSVAALVVVLLFELTTGEQPNGIGFLLVLFFAAATLLPNRSVIALGLGATIAFSATVYAAGAFDASMMGRLVLPFAGATVFVLLISVGIRTQLDATSDAYLSASHQKSELQRQERELSRLYEVSLTIGAGSKLHEVVPELVGRIADSVKARVGLVLLFDADTERLELMSPIWVSGHAVPADEFSLGLDEPSMSTRVFMSGDASLANDIADDPGRDRMATELKAERIAVVAMRVENRTIGVLLVGDKEDDFTQDDLKILESVAAPAALVLNQMARYDEAQSTSERMAELAQLKSDFVSVVSHELRTPLTSIIGAIGTLQRPELLPEDPRAQQLIAMAAKQANRLKVLIEDLLVMSRIEAESLPVRPKKIDLDHFLTELIDTLPDSDKIVCEPTSDLGFVRADPDHLARVVTNLVDNALKYGGDGTVEVQASNAGDEVHILIIDHGPGIPYEQHEVIFHRFTQLQPHATRSKGGVGLGLSIVRGLVEAMNGRVWYEPTPGGGATFAVAVPAEAVTDLP